MNKKPGQPTKYLKYFHNEDFLRLSKQGKSVSQIALDWNIDRSTIYEWANTHDEFSDTIKKGKGFAEGWYMNLGQAAMLGEVSLNGKKIKVDVGLYVWLTKNMFKWSDRVDANQKVEHAEALRETIVINEEQVKVALERLNSQF